ncbi:DUF4062 domain-containing protein [candidate division KSB1 bacterium]|nr:DUF4062 domain-containing protein [candidate division KSB1 bacterium]
MARPRIFVSSTYYDLKYVRASLGLFIESLGFDPVLSEKGDVAFVPDRALDESCFRELQNCDIYVLIIGGRYGSEISATKTGMSRDFFDRYESVTKMEYTTALKKDIPIYILIERAVYSEYQTFLKNRESPNINYAHVDSVNVYYFIDQILSQLRNNPFYAFDKYSEIEEWLRLQWAGLFRDLLYRLSSQQSVATLVGQVNELAEINNTMRRYLEEVIHKVLPSEAEKIIDSEAKRLKEAYVENSLKVNGYFRWLERFGIPFSYIREALENASTPEEFKKIIRNYPGLPEFIMGKVPLMLSTSMLQDINNARKLLNRPEFSLLDADAFEITLRGQ